MKLEDFKKDYPDITKALIKEGDATGYERGFKEGETAGHEKASKENQDAAKQEAKTEEKKRILGLAVIQFGVQAGEAFKAVVETGVTEEQFAAIRKTQPEQASTDKQEEMLEAIHNAGAEDVGQGKASTGTGKDFMTQVEEHVALHKCSKTVAMQAVIKKDPAAHQAYLDSVN